MNRSGRPLLTVEQVATRALREGGCMVSCPTRAGGDEYKVSILDKDDTVLSSYTVTHDLLVRLVGLSGVVRERIDREEGQKRYRAKMTAVLAKSGNEGKRL